MDAISWQLLIEGAWTTLWISAIAIAFGVVAGLRIALVRMLRPPVIDQVRRDGLSFLDGVKKG
ncbi:hypothetical protein K4G96_26985, partial [Mycobacterium tuberculosis]|nr:hypothetical protein [Mycobacterium tuberculosis]